MAISSYPFDGQVTTETQFSKLFRELQDSGIATSQGSTDMKVTADASGMNVKVNPGFAIVRGFAVESTAIETLTIAPAGSQARVDRVVLRLDPATNSITPVVLQGSAGGSAPAVTQTDTGTYEISLATVAVGANVTNIASTAVTDDRHYVGHRVGVWSADTRPAVARKGQVGYNVTSTVFEYWDGAAWVDLLAWAKVSGKPATFPPDPHTHDPSAYSVAYAASAGNADTVDGQHAAAFAAAGHGHSSVPNAGYATNAGYASGAGNADTVDGLHASAFMQPGGAYTMGNQFPFTFPSLTVGSSYNLTLSSGMVMQRSSSSRRYKKDIADLDVSVDELYELRPRQYRYDNDVAEVMSDERLQGGFIAEEVAELLPLAVIHDAETGRIEDIHDRSLISAAFKLIRDLNARVKELEAVIEG